MKVKGRPDHEQVTLPLPQALILGNFTLVLTLPSYPDWPYPTFYP